MSNCYNGHMVNNNNNFIRLGGGGGSKCTVHNKYPWIQLHWKWIVLSWTDTRTCGWTSTWRSWARGGRASNGYAGRAAKSPEITQPNLAPLEFFTEKPKWRLFKNKNWDHEYFRKNSHPILDATIANKRMVLKWPLGNSVDRDYENGARRASMLAASSEEPPDRQQGWNSINIFSLRSEAAL